MTSAARVDRCEGAAAGGQHEAIRLVQVLVAPSGDLRIPGAARDLASQADVHICRLHQRVAAQPVGRQYVVDARKTAERQHTTPLSRNGRPKRTGIAPLARADWPGGVSRGPNCTGCRLVAYRCTVENLTACMPKRTASNGEVVNAPPADALPNLHGRNDDAGIATVITWTPNEAGRSASAVCRAPATIAPNLTGCSEPT